MFVMFTILLQCVSIDMMMVLDEKSDDHKRVHECLNKVLWQSIQQMLRHFTNKFESHGGLK